jgi:hypothetical protein
MAQSKFLWASSMKESNLPNMIQRAKFVDFYRSNNLHDFGMVHGDEKSLQTTHA